MHVRLGFRRLSFVILESGSLLLFVYDAKSQEFKLNHYWLHCRMPPDCYELAWFLAFSLSLSVLVFMHFIFHIFEIESTLPMKSRPETHLKPILLIWMSHVYTNHYSHNANHFLKIYPHTLTRMDVCPAPSCFLIKLYILWDHIAFSISSCANELSTHYFNVKYTITMLWPMLTEMTISWAHA